MLFVVLQLSFLIIARAATFENVCTYRMLAEYQQLFLNDQCMYIAKSTGKASTQNSLNTNYCLDVCSEDDKDRLDHVKHGEGQEFQKVVGRQVYVYSAYYEARKLAGGPAVRILAAGWQAEYNNIGSLYCQFWYSNQDNSVKAGRAKYKVIYKSTMWPQMWVAHFVICKLPQNIEILPFAVSVTAEECGKPETVVQIQNTHMPPPPSGGFEVCISTLHSRFNDWLSILEWIEIHKILGADEITFYNLSASSDINQILDSYLSDPGEHINVVNWKTPRETMYNSSYHIQRLMINDCMYRTMYRQKYVTIQDIDEIIIPRKYDTWKPLMSEISKPDTGIYMFQHAYFRRNTSSVMDYISLSSFWRTPEVFPAGNIRCKSMYDGVQAVAVDIHYHYELIPGSKPHMIPQGLAMLHHYRPEPMETFRKNPDIEFIEDRYMERYKGRLLSAINKRVGKMGGWKVFKSQNRNKLR